MLARKGLKVVVAERDSSPGGRCVTRQFHPGFFASPYADEVAAIPADIFRALDLARRGVILAPPGEPTPVPEADAIRAAVVARAMEDAAAPPRRGLFATPPPVRPWPGEDLAARPLAELAGEAASGCVCDPALAGSALWLLAGRPSGMPAGGLGRLGAALRQAAEEAGAEISCGLEATDIRRRRGRVVGVGLADGNEFAARAVVSTLDVKRTFLSLFAWNDLPRPLVERVGGFRPAPGTARLLVALEALPESQGDLRRPIRLTSDPPGEAYHAWRSAAVPARPPAVLRVVSAVDPFLAPDGAAVLTVTLGAVPHAPFDGAWTKDKRDRLREAALAAVEEALPGTAARVKATELLVPPDTENLLGITGGDLWGGDLAAAQMLAFRPFAECRGTRTPVEGVYLAGPSSALGPLATCASGVAAACAVAADIAAGRLK